MGGGGGRGRLLVAGEDGPDCRPGLGTVPCMNFVHWASSLNNDSVSMSCPFGRHTENAWKQQHYDEQGSEITEVAPLSSMVGEMLLGSRANLREQEGKLCKVSLLRKD